MRTFDDYKNEVSSEKITLATVEASKRLMGWALDSGSIYKITNFDVASIVSIEDSGITYTEVASVASCTASKFYNDRENKILYLRSTGSVNPNSLFIVLTQRFFFSNAPIVLPYDLNTGTDVYWEPMIKSTSSFGVEIDTVNQTSEAIEGSGTLTLFNDSDFWPSNFDKLSFENKNCSIYSFGRGLAATEAKLIFKGYVEKKDYKSSEVKFSLKDIMSQLKSPIPLANIEDLALRTSPSLAKAKQRMILGRVYGHRPVNTDEVLTGYPMSGTVSIASGTTLVNGSGTSFLSKLSPDDVLVLGGTDYTIATITSNTVLNLSESYSGTTGLSASAFYVKPNKPKRYMNRNWNVAGHALRQPTTTTTDGCTITRLFVNSTADIYDGDWIYVGTLGSGDLVQVSSVVGSKLLTLNTSLSSVPVAGVTLIKPAVQNVRIDDVLLTYYQDYTFNPTTATLVLSPNAEANSGPVRQMASTVTFNSTTTVTGTLFDSLLKPGDLVSCVGQGSFFEILSVDSATQLTLRTAASFSATAKGLYKSFVFDPSSSVLTCDVLGRTDDNTSTGNLLATAPEIAQRLLEDAGLTDLIDTTSFTLAQDLASQGIGIVIPEKLNDTKAPIYREVLNKVNQSVLGSIVQTEAFNLRYLVLQPFKDTAALRLDEADILSISVKAAFDKIIKTATVNYRPQEYNYLTGGASVETEQKLSDYATYIVKTDIEKVFRVYLCDATDAQRHAYRMSFILENASANITLSTKLQSISLEVGSIVDISHRKIYERVGSTSTRKLAMVEAIKKTGSTVSIELVDLSNAFNRVGSINSLTTTWSDSNEEARIYGGFVTDSYGLIDNDPDSSTKNLIW